MSIRFVATSSQRLTLPNPLATIFGMTIGVWVYPITTGANSRVIVCVDNNLGLYFTVYMTTGAQFTIDNSSGTATGGTVTNNAWHYIVLRGIAAGNQRVDILEPSGIQTSLQSVALTDPAAGGLSEIWLGALRVGTQLFNDGLTAEYFLTASDIQPDGAALNGALLRQLAYRGPFSVPSIKKDLIEYRSFREHPILGKRKDIYYGAKGIQTWTNVNGVTIGPHVPLTFSYKKPYGLDDSRTLFLAETTTPSTNPPSTASGSLYPVRMVNPGTMMIRS